jgi:hypothetical protein
VHPSRLPLLLVGLAGAAALDVASKSVSGGTFVDAPGSLLKPVLTAALLPVVLCGVMMLPALCVPGALLVLAGLGGNLAALVLWHSVPDPLTVAVAGGRLHLDFADLALWSGCAVFLVAALWTIWRLPENYFA